MGAPIDPADRELLGWLIPRIPPGWFRGRPEVLADEDELLLIGRLAEPTLPPDAPPGTVASACRARIASFREDSRELRMTLASEVERRFGRRISWGVTCADERQLFSNLSLPVMTRLRLPERAVLDTLIDAGVARSRSEALAWCVRLVNRHQGEWIEQLRDAVQTVDRVRAQGPEL